MMYNGVLQLLIACKKRTGTEVGFQGGVVEGAIIEHKVVMRMDVVLEQVCLMMIRLNNVYGFVIFGEASVWKHNY